jgi:hypothetical protein
VLNGFVEWVLKNLPSTGYIARLLLEEEHLHIACFNGLGGRWDHLLLRMDCLPVKGSRILHVWFLPVRSYAFS